ncbi:MAG: TIGR01244 family phosphatase [Rhodobacteraceae bacterium]|nr:TIGR01244 family phosphatase [Paracoccaceae bacterium]
MKISLVAPDYSVAGQIAESDLADLAADGFKTIICNRPDAEVDADLHQEFIAAEAKRLGMAFVYNPVSNQGMTMENLTLQAEAIATANGPVLAYCRSGMRSTVVWSLVSAGRLPVDDILAAAAGAGYQIDNLRGQIEAMATRG